MPFDPHPRALPLLRDAALARSTRTFPALGLVALGILGACRGTSSELRPAAAQAAANPRTEAAPSFAGLWTTTYGPLRIVTQGARMSGSYAYAGRSTFEGEVQGRWSRLAYEEPDGTRGRALFELSEDGRSFTGVWQPELGGGELALEDPGAQRWEGERIEPVPGRAWFVVLEAHWEEGLSEHEYSYGAMLRSFLERLPEVEVRQRFFHDPADLVNFCQELEYIAEPLVLYISSHGSAAGLEVGGATIDGRTLGEALRHAGDLRLLHLGGCSMMAGDMAADIRAACAPHAPFPISGFTVDVDWAGSALIDFAYMDLVLEQGLAPAEAVRQVRSMISFAGAREARQAAIPCADLVISDPASLPSP